jgi:hypothetical protein
MTYSREEVEALRKRLDAVEAAIKELKREDLAIVKKIGMDLCRMEYAVGLSFQEGEERKLYSGLWSKKLEAAYKALAASRTVESVFEIIRKFISEHADYMRAEKVKSAKEAMDIAHGFIKKYSTVALPMKAVREDDVWLVDIDVGALATKIAKVKVDARTGEISSYEIPEKSTKKHRTT